MSAGTVAGGGITRVGDRGYFMNCSHVGHDCVVGNDVIFATSATLAAIAKSAISSSWAACRRCTSSAASVRR